MPAMILRLVLSAALGLALSGHMAMTARAEAVTPETAARVELLPGWRRADGSHLAALRIRLAPGWKTYWRAPGDAGIPPVFSWDGARNAARISVIFPTPEVFHQGGMRSIGYEGDVILPLSLKPRRADADIRLSGHVEIGVCEDICIPVSYRISATLAAKGGARDGRISAALIDTPRPGAEAGVARTVCRVAPLADGLRLTAEIAMPRLARQEEVVIELADRSVWVSEPDTRREGSVLRASADLVPAANAPFALDRSQVRITVLGTDDAVDILGCTGG